MPLLSTRNLTTTACTRSNFALPGTGLKQIVISHFTVISCDKHRTFVFNNDIHATRIYVKPKLTTSLIRVQNRVRTAIWDIEPYWYPKGSKLLLSTCRSKCTKHNICGSSVHKHVFNSYNLRNVYLNLISAQLSIDNYANCKAQSQRQDDHETLLNTVFQVQS